jgi:DNA-binding LacI/PurR family transcriptional regulator
VQTGLHFSEIVQRMKLRNPSVSAREVAFRAGVSRSAVSRTFTPGASVSDETRRKVLEAAEALGYHVNQLARGLTRQESGIVCLIGSDLGTPYRANLLKALTQQLQNAGKVAMVINTDRLDGSVDLALRQAIRYRADGSIILSGMPDKSITGFASTMASGWFLSIATTSRTARCTSISTTPRRQGLSS